MQGKFELAKSSRASCRKCKEKILKDEPRFGEETIFVRNGNQYSSYRWYHINCAVDKFGEKLGDIEEGLDILSEEDRGIMETFRKKSTASAFSYKSISEVTGEEGLINIRGTVIRAMSPREHEAEDGQSRTGRVVYIRGDDEKRGKLILFNSVDAELEKGSKIFLHNAVTRLGQDGNPEVIEGDQTKVYFSEDEIPKLGEEKKYFSLAWERPPSMFCEFEIAPSGRATCPVCSEKIKKGTLRLIKPVWGKNEITNQVYAQKVSMHIQCAPEDEHGEEILREAISRLSPGMLAENKDEFQQLATSLKERELSVHEQLEKYLV